MLDDSAVRILGTDGKITPSASAEPYLEALEGLQQSDLENFYRDMVMTRAFDLEATNLQRQGHMALWPPSVGQEGAQVGSAYATRASDHIFPSYREHAVAKIRGVDLVDIIKVMRGVSPGGWDPKATNLHLYCFVIGSQTLHATGYALGQKLDGTDEATLVYFGDGATSQGDVNEALVFASSYQVPLVFFLQNNQWAISVPVTRQSRQPLYKRAHGFGIPSAQIDGNDVLASYAVTKTMLDRGREGGGPGFVEALTYRIGAHTTSDDPTKYRTDDELHYWQERDPIIRLETHLRENGVDEAFFTDVRDEAKDLAADVRKRTLVLADPPVSDIFQNVYSEPHPLMDEQLAWLREFEGQFEEGRA